ncbi:hypothetical protein [Methylobacterium sp. JK268]
MTSPPALPTAEAALFTLGCVLIHARGGTGERLTRILAGIACALFLVYVAMASPAETVAAEAAADLGSALPLPDEPAMLP